MRDAVADQFPLTTSQSKFWQGQKLHPELPLYNMAWRFDLEFELDVPAFQKAYSSVVNDSDALRLVFWTEQSTPYQRALAEGAKLEFFDFSPSSDPEAELQAQLTGWVQDPFDLSVQTTRSYLVKLAANHWVWVLCQHHIVCDAQTGSLIFKAVSDRYLGKWDELPAFLGSAPFLAGPDQELNEAVSISPTPPYGSESRRSGRSQRFELTLGEAFDCALARAIETPDFRMFTPDLSRLTFYLSAFIAYLHRVTGDERLRVGLPTHNRLSARDRAVIGLFVEVLPFDMNIDEGETFLSLHQKVKAAQGTFLRAARPGSAGAQSAQGVGAILNYIQAQFGDFAGQPAKVRWLHCGAQDVEVPLRLQVMNFDASVAPTLALDVAEELTGAINIENASKHLKAVLNSFIEIPDLKISAMPMGDAGGDDQAVLHSPMERARSELTILDLIEQQSLAGPNAVALRSGQSSVTYKELSERSDSVAGYLADLGVTPGHSVALNLHRSFDCMVAALGIMKAGCAFVPISALTPYGRVEQIVKASDAVGIFATDDVDFEFSCPRFDVGAAREMPVDKVHVAPLDRAYILFTSGSTGEPKGVSVSHGGLSRYIQWACLEFGGGEALDYAFFSSISFDLTLTSMFAPLICGGTVVIYPETSGTDLAVLDVFAEDAVDVVKLTPSHLSLVCKQAKPVERISKLVLGGENLTRSLCETALSKLSSELEIINEYGPTEAVVGAMQHRYTSACDLKASVPIGLPADGMSITIRDEDLNICPVAVTGEMVIGGRLADGYVNQLSEKFLQDPLDPANRIYRTGDLGRLRIDGTLEYLGRADRQIKIGGVRVEAAEIEGCALQCDAVDSVYLRQPESSAAPNVASVFCRTCGLPDTYPGAEFSADGQCAVCSEFQGYKDRAQAYFQPEPELKARVDAAARRGGGDYDAIMLLSGGKDSTYAAYRLADLTDRVLAVTLDNGYISDGAKANVERVSRHLGWDHRYLRTEQMNAIFVDSLKTHSNVCQGCFKAIYTLALRTARAEGIPIIATGLSRGQFFETRLTPNLFRNGAPTCAELDDMVHRARKTYHAEDDALSKLMQTDDLKDGKVLDEVEIIDIYRFIDVPVSEIYEFLETKTEWRRPSDTGRSTNCLINDVGIHVHKLREGYHNYALPYSWDVRMGHKTRSQALDELDDEIDEGRVHQVLSEIGFDEPIERPSELTLYVAGEGVDLGDVWEKLRSNLSREVLPKQVVVIDEMPLTSNGKVDHARLPKPDAQSREVNECVAPTTEMERKLAAILGGILNRTNVGVTQDFFDLGIDSLASIEIAMQANELGIALPATALFDHRCLRDLAVYAESLATIKAETFDETEALIDLNADDLSQIFEAMN